MVFYCIFSLNVSILILKFNETFYFENSFSVTHAIKQIETSGILSIIKV